MEHSKCSRHEDLPARPLLDPLISVVSSGLVKHLWMDDQSRLLRHDQMASVFLDERAKQGVTLYTRDGQYDLSSSEDNLSKQRPEAVAEVDNTTRAERTYLARLKRIRSGCWHSGPPPYGYRLQDCKLAIDPIEAQWVKRMFEMSATGASPAAIKKTLATQGVRTRIGGLWSTRSVAATLQSPHYAGQYTFEDAWSGQQIVVLCPQFGNATTWEAVQMLQSQHEHRHRQKNATQKHFYLLRDLMYCAHCGRPISGRQNPLRGEAVYYCANKDRLVATDGTGHGTPRQRGDGCGMVRSMNIHRADERVLKHVQELHARSSLLREEVKQHALVPLGLTHMDDQDERNRVEAKIRRLQKELTANSESMGRGDASVLQSQLDDVAHAPRCST